jgi:hypothetical protein
MTDTEPTRTLAQRLVDEAQIEIAGVIGEVSDVRGYAVAATAAVVRELLAWSRAEQAEASNNRDEYRGADWRAGFAEAMIALRNDLIDGSVSSPEGGEPPTPMLKPCDHGEWAFCDCNPPSEYEQKVARAEQLGYCETSIRASADPEDGEQCPELRVPGYVHCEHHGGGQQ